jgi:plasmid stabilization system protein ParE
VIFYRIVDEQIVVMRVLHSAQDPVRHLGKD